MVFLKNWCNLSHVFLEKIDLFTQFCHPPNLVKIYSLLAVLLLNWIFSWLDWIGVLQIYISESLESFQVLRLFNNLFYIQLWEEGRAWNIRRYHHVTWYESTKIFRLVLTMDQFEWNELNKFNKHWKKNNSCVKMIVVYVIAMVFKLINIALISSRNRLVVSLPFVFVVLVIFLSFKLNSYDLNISVEEYSQTLG